MNPESVARVFSCRSAYTGERWRHARKREGVLAATAATLALVYALGTAEQQGSLAIEAIAAERIAAHYAATVAGCLNEGMIVWIDPHTKAEMGTFCDTQVLSHTGRKPHLP